MELIEGGVAVQARIRQVRKHYNMTQAAFGELIGVKANTVTGYETGNRAPSDAIITSICREFDVNEDWLRTGQGEMLIKKSRDQEIAAFMGDVLKGDPDFRRRFIAVLSRMTLEEWELLERKMREILDEP